MNVPSKHATDAASCGVAYEAAEEERKGIARLPFTIVILSFNRRDYLSRVLETLRPQLSRFDRVLLFQDGGWNPFTRSFRASEAEIEQCTAAFGDIILSKEAGDECALGKHSVFRHHVNVGIAINYWTAETYVFNIMKCRYALFLEDDLELSNNYLDIMSDLVNIALNNRRIGYVSGYGNLWASLEEQEKNKSKLIRMHENWGFALTRESWKAQNPIRNAYLKLVSGCDYRFRDQKYISTLFSSIGYNCRYTTQDASRWVACHAAGMVRLTPYTCHARYIGVKGEHSNFLHYEKYKFDKSVFFPSKPSIETPTEDEIDAWYKADTENFQNGYEHSYIR